MSTVNAAYDAAVPGCLVCGRMKVKVGQDRLDQARAVRVQMRKANPFSLSALNKANAHLAETGQILASHLLADHGIDVHPTPHADAK
jgi:hypothetical protein